MKSESARRLVTDDLVALVARHGKERIAVFLRVVFFGWGGGGWICGTMADRKSRCVDGSAGGAVSIRGVLVLL